VLERVIAVTEVEADNGERKEIDGRTHQSCRSECD
jgi:hypothetical protein